MRIHFNLLPPAQKKHLATQKVLRSIIESEIYVVAVCVVFVLTLLSMYIVLDGEADAMYMAQQHMYQDPAYREVAATREMFAATHKDVALRSVMTKNHYRWARVIDAMNTAMADGVFVDELSSADNVVTLRATARRREDVVALKERFRAVRHNDGTPCFTDLTVPESDLAAPTDVTFTMTFRVDPQCLRSL